MNALGSNVVGLKTSSVYEDIQTWLYMDASKSVETRKLYNREVRRFFMYMRNKKIEELTVFDLKFRNADIVRYQGYLKKEKQYANTTVNSAMSAITSLYTFFQTNEYPVDAAHMKVAYLPDLSESYGKLSIAEAEEMARRARNQTKGVEKSALIRLAYTTSLRKDELMSLEWGDIQYIPKDRIYLVHVVGKGEKKNTMPITEDMYKELLKIKDEKYYQRYDDDRIFHLSNTTIQSMMNRLRKEMGIHPERNIVFHSFRSLMAEYIRETENDPYKIQRQLNHSNINTSMKYLSKNEDYASMPSVQFENRVKDDVFEDLNRDQLLELVKSLEHGAKHQAKHKALVMIKK